MSRFAKIFFSLLALVAVFGVSVRLQDMLRRDPFAGFKSKDVFGDIGIKLTGVLVKRYSGDKLVGLANVDTINVRQDRQYLDFINVKEGSFESKHGNFTFSAETAQFNAITHQLNVTSGSKVKNKDLDVATAEFMYDQNTGILTLPGKVSGKLFDGTIDASNMSYNSGEDSYHIAQVKWVGTLSKEALGDVSAQSSRTKWSISGENFSHMGGKETYSNGMATDGEILVKAPNIERDVKTDVLTATGQVYYFGQKANLICEKAVVYRKEKRAILSGHVHMLVKPKDQEKLEVTEMQPYRPPVPADVAKNRPTAPQDAESQQQKDLDDELRSSKTARKYPTHIKAEQIEYWYGKGSRHAIITGSPQAYQELAGGRWRRAATFKAFYDGEKDELTMESNASGNRDVHFVSSIGDNLQAEAVTLSTVEDSEDWHGKNVTGDVASEDQDLNNASKTGTTTAPATTPPATVQPGTTQPAPNANPGQNTPPTPPAKPPA